VTLPFFLRDPIWWADLRTRKTQDTCLKQLWSFADVDDPSPSDDVRPWPSAQLHTIDRERDSESVRVMSRTEVMISDFYTKGHLTQRLGQALVSIL